MAGLTMWLKTLGRRFRYDLAQVKTAVFAGAGLGFMAASAYQVNTGVGLLATGAAILLFDFGTERGERR